ncbi:hypothetical protein IID10_16965, partial [candidate division KSB1 bacterium]|nr:hypothetical protein [candidate division KSB1 bacterium]
MNRRNFFASGLGSLAAIMLGKGKVLALTAKDEEIRAAFPRVEEQTYLNAAAMMPLSTFSEQGLRRYIEFQRLGDKNGRLEYVRQVQAQIRTLFADLIGAETSEIGLVHCTKAGEQIVLDSLNGIEQGEN